MSFLDLKKLPFLKKGVVFTLLTGWTKELTGDEKDLERKLGQFHRLVNRFVERSEKLEKIESKKEKEGERIRIDRQMKRYKVG